MTILTDVWFAHDAGALAGTLDELADLDVRVIREASTDPDGNLYFFRFDGVDLADVRDVLEADPTVRSVRPMPEFAAQRLLGVEFASSTRLLAPAVTDAGGYVLDARATSGDPRPPGWFERWLLPDHESLRTIWQHARRAGYDFEIVELDRQGRMGEAELGPRTLTDQQRAALVAAYESGYFAEPREASLEEVAERLDISPSAVAGRLRRGMKSLVGATIVVDRPER